MSTYNDISKPVFSFTIFELDFVYIFSFHYNFNYIL